MSGKLKAHGTTAFYLILVLLLALGSVVSAAPAAGVDPQEIVLNATHNGKGVGLNGEVLVVRLPSQPATGYSWQARGLDQAILHQLDSEWVPDAVDKLGGTGTEVLRFVAVGIGRAVLNLAYVRPWETAKPNKTFSVEVVANKPSGSVDKLESAAEEPAATAPDASTLAVPAAYNSCPPAGCTPVRDQGQCGSCWAFGTLGPVEQNILIKDGASKDLSEQWLLSCNTDGYDCGGGWWVHRYFVSPGAVYESDFPYTATDAPCGGPYTYHEKISSWAYVDPSVSVPSTAAIKQAIYDHGPISAAVCVNLAFQLYSGGVFSPATSCSSINHAIVLVGWDDSKGAWLLRNSWGPDWGEDGYMWIGYGKNYVGYSAVYVVYNGTTPVTPPAAPSGLTATAVSYSQINLTWADNADNEDGFEIERCTGAGCSIFAQIATVGANVTSYANTGLAASTSYSYRVRAYNSGGYSDYCEPATAVTPAAPAVPAAPTNLVATAVSKSQINLTWADNADNEAGFYIERCKGATCTKFTRIATVGANVTNYANTKLVANTTYRYRVRAYNAGGTSAYSNTATATTLRR